jgi:hypothetical protein
MGNRKICPPGLILLSFFLISCGSDGKIKEPFCILTPPYLSCWSEAGEKYKLTLEQAAGMIAFKPDSAKRIIKCCATCTTTEDEVLPYNPHPEIVPPTIPTF